VLFPVSVRITLHPMCRSCSAERNPVAFFCFFCACAFHSFFSVLSVSFVCSVLILLLL
jgi:hypothetical protein